ncbi:MAG: aminotransferase class IV, partial [Pseudomonadota bacterium]
VVDAGREQIPEYPGSLYLRPVLYGTDENIGAAGTGSQEACLFVLGAPVGDYFGGAQKALRLLVEEDHLRSAPHFGAAKTGGNYASALQPITRARAEHNADQVLFCPGGEVQETGAANFMLINDNEIVTRSLDGAILHGVTRDSLLKLVPGLGYSVSERELTVDEMLEWCKTGEAVLSGTAAVLTSVGTLIRGGEEFTVGDGQPGPNAARLRDALQRIHSGEAEDTFGWLVEA